MIPPQKLATCPRREGKARTLMTRSGNAVREKIPVRFNARQKWANIEHLEGSGDIKVPQAFDLSNINQ